MILIPGFVYDAQAILGLGDPNNEPLPDPLPGEVVIRVPKMSFADLCACDDKLVSDRILEEMDELDKEDDNEEYRLQNEGMHIFDYQEVSRGLHDSCVRWKKPAGVYRVRYIPGSSGKSLRKQRKLLLPDEKNTPLVITAAILACHLKVTGQDLLEGQFIRCDETPTYQFLIDVFLRTVYVEIDDDQSSPKICFSGCRKIL